MENKVEQPVQPEQPNTLALPISLATGILDYLQLRPFVEVNQLIRELVALKSR